MKKFVSSVLLSIFLTLLPSYVSGLELKNQVPSGVWLHRKVVIKNNTKKRFQKAAKILRENSHPLIAKKVSKDVDVIYLVESMKHRRTGATICGTYFDNNLIIATNKDCDIHNVDYYVAHEYSSIVLRKWRDKFPEKDWLKNNGFRYDSADKWEIISWVKVKNAHFLNKNGFFRYYCTVSLEEDFNVLIGYYYEDRAALRKMTDNYTKVRNKAAIAVKFFEMYAGR